VIVCKDLAEYIEYYARAKERGIAVANAAQQGYKMLEHPVRSLFSNVYEDTGRTILFMILDEVQYVKNHSSKTQITIEALPYMIVIYASGTSLPN
jgi:hypothetical protein